MKRRWKIRSGRLLLPVLKYLRQRLNDVIVRIEKTLEPKPHTVAHAPPRHWVDLVSRYAPHLLEYPGAAEPSHLTAPLTEEKVDLSVNGAGNSNVTAEKKREVRGQNKRTVAASSDAVFSTQNNPNREQIAEVLSRPGWKPINLRAAKPPLAQRTTQKSDAKVSNSTQKSRRIDTGFKMNEENTNQHVPMPWPEPAENGKSPLGGAVIEYSSGDHSNGLSGWLPDRENIISKEANAVSPEEDDIASTRMVFTHKADASTPQTERISFTHEVSSSEHAVHPDTASFEFVLHENASVSSLRSVAVNPLNCIGYPSSEVIANGECSANNTAVAALSDPLVQGSWPALPEVPSIASGENVKVGYLQPAWTDYLQREQEG